jgi:uncharacterized protein (TIGR03437 family)
MVASRLRFLLSFSLVVGAFAQTPTFGPLSSFAAQQAPLAIAAGDFNGDGFQDLAVGNADSASVSIFLGTGTGSFSTAAAVPLTSGCQVAYLYAGKFTGAANPDLLAVCPLGVIEVLPNTGHGTFGTAIPTTLPLPAWVGNLLLGYIHPAFGDFNGDGKLDIAIQGLDQNNAPGGDWYVLLGKGTGAFGTASELPFVNAAFLDTIVPLSITAGDFNGDGKLDLVTAVTDGDSNQFFEFAAGNGDGTFQKAFVYSLPGTFGSLLLAADVNGDGNLDVVIAGAALATNLNGLLDGGMGQSAITVFLGDGKGNFKMGFNTIETPYVSGAVLASVRGTGKLDLVETVIGGDFANGGPPSGAIQIRPGNGDGTFGNPVALSSYPSLTIPTDLAIADFNGDGHPDIAIASLPSKAVTIDASLVTDFASLLTAVLQSFPNGSATVMLNTTVGVTLTFSDTNAASFATGAVAKGSIVSAFGSNLATSTASDSGLPLPLTLGGATISIKDASGATLSAPLFYASPSQINFEIPDAAAAGAATITIQAGGSVFTATQQIQSVAPGIFSSGGLAVGSVIQLVNGVQQTTSILQNGALAPINVSGGQTYLVLYGTGIHNHANPVTLVAGSTQTTAAYAGMQGVYVGEDQINVQLPASLQGAGKIGVSLVVDGQTSNTVQILIQ